MKKIGLQFTASGKDMQITVTPGHIKGLEGGQALTLQQESKLEVRPAGSRRYTKQRYKLRGVGEQSPAGWNGEDIRGSGGAPYQRMVPNSLTVYDQQREVRYEPDQDYIVDWYWGTIKRKPGGKLEDGQMLSLDYEVWLCRYDAVVLVGDNQLTVVEGAMDANDSRELLLPDPPIVREGVVLAHVFAGWGQSAIHDGRLDIAQTAGAPEAQLPAVVGRYEDMTPRTYLVEVVEPHEGESIWVRIGMTGEDYGTDRVLDADSVRWSEPQPVVPDKPLPLRAETAYNRTVNWGLALDFSKVQALPQPGTLYEITAAPFMILRLDGSLQDPVSLIEVEHFQHTDLFMERLRRGEPVRIAFYGESTTRSGKWPYLLAQRLREAFPTGRLLTSNVAVGGESSMRGIERLEDEVLSLNPDLVLIEYFINNSASGQSEESERSLRAIIEKCQAQGAACVLMSHNGRNPLFSWNGDREDTVTAHNQFRRIAEETGSAFIGGYSYYHHLHRMGRYFLSELKGNMVNHPYGNVDFTWGGFDQAVAEALWRGLTGGK